MYQGGPWYMCTPPIDLPARTFHLLSCPVSAKWKTTNSQVKTVPGVKGPVKARGKAGAGHQLPTCRRHAAWFWSKLLGQSWHCRNLGGRCCGPAGGQGQTAGQRKETAVPTMFQESGCLTSRSTQPERLRWAGAGHAGPPHLTTVFPLGSA